MHVSQPKHPINYDDYKLDGFGFKSEGQWEEESWDDREDKLVAISYIYRIRGCVLGDLFGETREIIVRCRLRNRCKFFVL
jgi:hypothetical protein